MISSLLSDAAQDLSESFFEIIENEDIRTVFQPIISLRDSSILGYEALSRGPSESAMNNPEILFEYAEKHSKIWELELICRSKALESARMLQL